jgi:small basic protein
MWFVLIGLAIGIAIGVWVPYEIPTEFARYTAIGILGVLDSVFGAARADLQHKYNHTIFISGLIFNMTLAVAITYLGDKLSLNLYLAVIIVFTLRIFANIGTMRYWLLTKTLSKKRIKEEIQEKQL